MRQSKLLEKNREKWDEWADSIDGSGWKYQFLRRAQRATVDLLQGHEKEVLLDIGCGTGWALGEAARSNGDSGEFYGVDLSAKMVEKAKENFGGRNNFHFIESNAEAIPLPDRFCSGIICTNSFHHYVNPVKVLQEMHRLMKPGAKTYILDSTADGWIVRVIDRFARIFDPAHVKLYSSSEFHEMMSEAHLRYSGSKEIQKYQLIHIGEK